MGGTQGVANLVANLVGIYSRLQRTGSLRYAKPHRAKDAQSVDQVRCVRDHRALASRLDAANIEDRYFCARSSTRPRRSLELTWSQFR